MQSENSIDSGPSAEEIRAVVESIVGSPGFRHSPQLVSFLRFVVESTLSGKAASIKSYSIGIEALGRRDDFDPSVDPIVRVEAGRVRPGPVGFFFRGWGGHPV